MKSPENLQEFTEYKQECLRIVQKLSELGNVASLARRRLVVNEFKKNIKPLQKIIDDAEEALVVMREYQVELDALIPNGKRKYLPVLKDNDGNHHEFTAVTAIGNALIARNAAQAEMVRMGTLNHESVFCQRLVQRDVSYTRNFKVFRKSPRPVGTGAGVKRKKKPNVLVGCKNR